jgi:hypothetical protein
MHHRPIRHPGRPVDVAAGQARRSPIARSIWERDSSGRVGAEEETLVGLAQNREGTGRSD